MKLKRVGKCYTAETCCYTVGAEIRLICIEVPTSHLPRQMQAVREAVCPSTCVLFPLMMGLACAALDSGTGGSSPPDSVFPQATWAWPTSSSRHLDFFSPHTVELDVVLPQCKPLQAGSVSPQCHSLPSTCCLLCRTGGTGAAQHLSVPNLTFSCSTTLVLAFNSPPVFIGLKILVMCPSRALGQVR